jgi:hypothetical protein
MHIDWSALGLVLLISVVAAWGLVALVGAGITALDQRVVAREAGRSATAPTAVMAVCFLGAAALIGYGIYLAASV